MIRRMEINFHVSGRKSIDWTHFFGTVSITLKFKMDFLTVRFVFGMRRGHLQQGSFIASKVGVSRMRIFSVILLVGSLILMIGVAFNYKNKKRQFNIANSEKMVAIHFWDVLPVPVLERNKIINESLKAFDLFIRSNSIAEKSAATSDSLNNISKMTPYYSTHPMEVVTGKPGLRSLALLSVDGHPFFVLTLEMADGSATPDVMELVFAKDEEGQWKLDWPQFVRYQEVPWKAFTSGDGPDEAEFRLWVSRESALDSDSEYCLKFYEPSRNGISELGIACPNVMVPKDSIMGKDIYRMLRINELQPEGYKNVFALNPGKGYMRIRAVLTKKQNAETNAWTYSLKKIVGEGWFSFPE